MAQVVRVRLLLGLTSGTLFGTRGVAVLLLFAAWVYVFVRVPLPSTVTPATSGLLGSVLARAAVIGITLIAALSGSAAAGAICDSYEHFARRGAKSLRDHDIVSASNSFERACADLRSRMDAAEELRQDIAAEAPRTGLSRFWSRSAKDRQLASLQTEIVGLESMASVMRDDLDALRERDRRQRYARTAVGRVLLVGGHLFSAYCAFRIALSLLDLLILGYRDAAPTDFVSLALAYAVRLLGIDIDVAAWAPQISLLFVGGLILMRMRVVLNTLSAMIRSVSTGISTGLLLLFTAEVLCIYTLATLIQLRSTVPTHGNHYVAGLLARLPEFQVIFGALFDGIFLAAALATALFRSFLWYSDATYADAM